MNVPLKKTTTAIRHLSLLAAVWLIASFTHTTAAQERISVQPSATLTWSDMEEINATQPPDTSARAIPLMPHPGPRILDISSFPAPMPGDFSFSPEAAWDEIWEAEELVSSAIPTSKGLPVVASDDFLGLEDDGTVIPPDTMGAAGPNHLMVMLNSQVRIQDKVGNPIGATISLSAFWSAGCSNSVFDPKLIFDSIDGRWIATVDADSASSNSKVCFAISNTDDPTLGWTFYSFIADPTGTTWADYPGFGVNSTWIAITNNMFTISMPSMFQGAKMWVIDKASALVPPLTVTVFPVGFDFSIGGTSGGFALQPAVTYDAAEPKLFIVDNSGYSTPAAPFTFLVRISEISGTGSTPSWMPTPGSAFTGTGLFPVAHDFTYAQVDAPQKGTADLIETNDARMLNAVFRNGRIWCTHSGGLPIITPDRTAVFWYQLNPADMPSPIVQSGLLEGGSGAHHFFPSITANAADDACIGFSRSDEKRFAEAAYVGRLGTDLPGFTGAIKTLKCGEASYFKDFGSGRNRWGDYSATVVDPSDDMSFYTLQEYADLPMGGMDRWATWWGRKSLPQPTPHVKPHYSAYATLGMTSMATNVNIHPEVWCPPNQLQFYCSVGLTVPAMADSCQVCELMAQAVNSNTDCINKGFSATCSGGVVTVENSAGWICPGAFVCFDPAGLAQLQMSMGVVAYDAVGPLKARFIGQAAGQAVDPALGGPQIIVIHVRRDPTNFQATPFRAVVDLVAGMSPTDITSALALSLQQQGDPDVVASGPVLTLFPTFPAGGEGEKETLPFDLTVQVNDQGLGWAVSPVDDPFALLGILPWFTDGFETGDTSAWSVTVP